MLEVYRKTPDEIAERIVDQFNDYLAIAYCLQPLDAKPALALFRLVRHAIRKERDQDLT